MKSRRALPKKSSLWDNPRFNELLQVGLDAKNSKDIAGAIKAFKRLIREFPKSSVAHWLLGGMHFIYRHDAKSALPWYRKAVALAPKNEKASLGLSNSFWALKRDDDGIAEMKRFLQVGYCEDYLGIAEEMYYKWVLDKDPPAWKKRRTPEAKDVEIALQQLQDVETLTES